MSTLLTIISMILIVNCIFIIEIVKLKKENEEFQIRIDGAISNLFTQIGDINRRTETIKKPKKGFYRHGKKEWRKK